MRATLIIFIVIPLLLAFQPVKETKNPIVLELFTSQGCSSCPPADYLLSTIEKEYPNVILLSYHVDYWNYIGWEDPFSNAVYSTRQSAYNKKFASTSYTPQLVINGKEHFVGSNKSKLFNILNSKPSTHTQNTMLITDINEVNNYVRFNYKIQGNIENKILHTLLVIDERITDISRGENRNKRLKNSNIVIQETYISIQDASGASQIEIPKITNKTDKLKFILLLENDDLEIVNGIKVKL
ncbi:thioredoxin family protein [uncultured Psychroserpens sp.]|uniref:DUF1223 domain-containing protein n=1 Tax=uncultured Psychroserpens sp. TaxID=255436 RepID=UPI002621125A|nr:DUF1223 domain-containing protein [uncultured Psychroserpens sp.]